MRNQYAHICCLTLTFKKKSCCPGKAKAQIHLCELKNGWEEFFDVQGARQITGGRSNFMTNLKLKSSFVLSFHLQVMDSPFIKKKSIINIKSV